jgi:hypothetical protein
LTSYSIELKMAVKGSRQEAKDDATGGHREPVQKRGKRVVGEICLQWQLLPRSSEIKRENVLWGL